MIVVAQRLRHRIVDGKGAGPIDQLPSSSRIARTSASRLRVNERSRLGGGPNTKLGRCVGISHDAQQEIERGYSRVRGSGGDRCIHECCLLVFRLVSILVALLFSEGLTWADRTRYTSHSVAR